MDSHCGQMMQPPSHCRMGGAAESILTSHPNTQQFWSISQRQVPSLLESSHSARYGADRGVVPAVGTSSHPGPECSPCSFTKHPLSTYYLPAPWADMESQAKTDPTGLLFLVKCLTPPGLGACFLCLRTDMCPQEVEGRVAERYLIREQP